MNTVKDNLPIVDSFGRIHNNLRIGVTDRCNIRCTYCMPENVVFLPRDQVLSFEEIHRFVSVVARHGINRLRLTGGEPLVRKGLPDLIRMLAAIKGIEDIALTSNGVLLADQAQILREAGLNRVNISLDTLDPDRFEQISRRRELDRVLNGISAAIDAGFDQLRLNTVSIAGMTETEIVPLAKFARERKIELRFIEFMPLDADKKWRSESVLDGKAVRAIVEKEIGPLVPAPRTNPSQPAVDFRYADGGGTIGFIDPVSTPFCGSCNRLRITAEGKLRNCLFSTVEWDVREILRTHDGSDSDIMNCVMECVGAKKAAHGIDTDDFQRPAKAMYQIGG